MRRVDKAVGCSTFRGIEVRGQLFRILNRWALMRRWGWALRVIASLMRGVAHGGCCGKHRRRKGRTRHTACQGLRSPFWRRRRRTLGSLGVYSAYEPYLQ